MDNSSETQVCGRCHEDLPIAKFGICTARANGRNFYCKRCVNKSVTGSRQKIRAWRMAQRKRDSQGNLPLIGLTPDPRPLPPVNIRNPEVAHHERVLIAIRRGARTQKEIFNAIQPVDRTSGKASSVARVDAMDQIGESLAILMLDTPRRVRTQIIKGFRVYIEFEASMPATEVAPVSFSTLGGIVAPTMKGRAA